LDNLHSNKIIEDNINGVEINKIVFLFGNVAPDLNCVYPAHRLKTTEHRFYNRLMIADRTDSKLIKSFTLGIITHYICDYFCYAHNIESLGVKHKSYETNLYEYYNKHLAEIEKDKTDLVKMWHNVVVKSHDDNIENDELTNETHCKMIIDTIKLMNESYMKNTGDKKDKDKDWFERKSQMKIDLEYAQFVIEQVIYLLTEPERCLEI
jgi:hypothetical protein